MLHSDGGHTATVDRPNCVSYPYKRHGEVCLASPQADQIPDISGQRRTSPPAGGSSLLDYALKKGLDFAVKYAENTHLPPKPSAKTTIALAPSPDQPLIAMTTEALINDPLEEFLRGPVNLPADWRSFLGSHYRIVHSTFEL